MKAFFIGLLAVAILALVVIGGALFNLEYYKFFAPKYQDAKREVYENTSSYVRGKQQRLTDLCLEYEKVIDNHKAAIRQVILLEVEAITENEDELGEYVQNCLAEMRK